MSSEDSDIHERCNAFITKMFSKPRAAHKPWVTMAYAQSIDGRMAAQVGQPRLILSGRESMLLTFHLRNWHDAILVTWKTLEADNSQLTVREIPGEIRQPQVVVLDPFLFSPPESRLFQSKRNIWIACSEAHLSTPDGRAKAEILQAKGVAFVPMQTVEGRIPLEILFMTLFDLQLWTIFVEPGLRLIPALLVARHLITALVVTVAPKLIGSGGRAPSLNDSTTLDLEHFQTLHVDDDVTFGSWLKHGALLQSLDWQKSKCLVNRLASIFKVPLMDGNAKVVRLGEGRQDWVAIKKITTSRLPQPHDAQKEISILSSLNHRNVVPLLEYGIINQMHHLAMPYYPLPLQHLLDNPKFTPQDTEGFAQIIQHLMYQMSAAIQNIHAHGIAHRDINPGNFVIGSTGRLVLIDFGIAYDGPNEFEPDNERCCDVGTGAFRAPELLFGHKAYDPLAIDIWALGATFASFFTGFQAPEVDSEEEVVRVLPPWQKVQQKSVHPDYRSTMFRGDVGDIALIGSIFNILGTPTAETWPESADMPTFGRFSFDSMPTQGLSSLLPNLPHHIPLKEGLINLISSMLDVSASRRAKADDIAEHAMFESRLTEVQLSTLLQLWLTQ